MKKIAKLLLLHILVLSNISIFGLHYDHELSGSKSYVCLEKYKATDFCNNEETAIPHTEESFLEHAFENGISITEKTNLNPDLHIIDTIYPKPETKLNHNFVFLHNTPLFIHKINKQKFLLRNLPLRAPPHFS